MALPLAWLVACGGSGDPTSHETGAAGGASESDPRSLRSDEPHRAVRDVVLISLDTLRWDALDFAADGPWATPVPTLARLAESGRRFTFAHAHNTVTLPSHANLLTGLYPYQHGVRDNAGFVLGDDVTTLATRLAEAGFVTGAFVSAFTVDARFGLDRGFQIYDDRVAQSTGNRRFHVSERPGDQTVALAVDWWLDHAAERRFLWLHLFDPHAPYAPPEPWASAEDHPYRGEVAATDAYLAPLLEALGDDVLVVVTADHGEGLGDHDEASHGLLAYESTLRVPLVLHGPGVETGVDPRLARHVDVMPTVLDALGLEAQDGPAPGRSLLRPPAEDDPGISYFECLGGALDRGWAPLRGVIRDRHKFIDLPIPELYDLAADPWEQNNLAGSDGAESLVASMRTLLPEESAWPPRRDTVDAETAAQLRSLGYLAGDDAAEGVTAWGVDDDPKNLMHLDAAIHRFADLFAAGRHAEAAAEARSMVAARPSMPVAHVQLAQALLEMGDVGGALDAMQSARRQGAAGPSLLRQLGLTLVEVGRTAEALEVLEPMAAGAGAADSETLSAYAMALDQSGRPGDARRVLLRALDLAPDDAAAHERLSVVNLRLGDAESARVHAARAVEIDPSLPHAWNNLGVALYLLGRPAEALDPWVRSVELDPDQFDTLYNLGLKAAELGRPDLARRALRDFIDRAPRSRYAADLPRARALLERLERSPGAPS